MAAIGQQELKQLLDYDSITGVFTWTSRKSNRITVGSIAGNVHKYGYRKIRINGKSYMAHRLAVLYMTGAWPEIEVDHINGTKDDNAYVNLRCVTLSTNRQNVHAPRKHSVSQLMGVRKRGNKWYAAITIDGKYKQIGVYDNAGMAHQAYLVTKRAVHNGCTI